MNAQTVAVFMVVMFVAAYAAAETYVRRARARDAARAARGRGEPAAWYRFTTPDDGTDRSIARYPSGSGPCR